MRPPLFGKLGSLGSSEDWPIMFWGNRGPSPNPVLDRTYKKQLCIGLSCPGSSSATAAAEHILCTAASTPSLLPLVPVCLNIPAEAEQIIATVVQQLFCTLLELQQLCPARFGRARALDSREVPHTVLPLGTTGHEECPSRAAESLQHARGNSGKGSALTRQTCNPPTTSLFPKSSEIETNG